MASPTSDPVSSVLPAAIAARILEEAGPHTRLVSHAYLALHPPPSSLAPTFPRGTSAAEMQAALTTFTPTLTTLDLHGIPRWYEEEDSCMTAVLAVAAATLPRLQRLLLPRGGVSLVPAILATLQACPQLHHLQVGEGPSIFSVGEGVRMRMLHGDDPGPSWAPLLCPPVSTRIRSLATLPASALGALSSAPAGAFPHLTSLSLRTGCDIGLPSPSQLAALAAAAPALASLRIGTEVWHDSCLASAQHLALLTCLTNLTLILGLAPETQPGSGAMLQRIGALTMLHSLTLSMQHEGWDPVGAGWLLRLTQLTCLAVDFNVYIQRDADDNEPPALEQVSTDVAAGVVQLSALQQLHIKLSDGDPYFKGGHGHPVGFFQHLMAATQLRRLRLEQLVPSRSEGLASLLHLTSLHLDGAHGLESSSRHDTEFGPCRATLCWVSQLPLLEEFVWTKNWAIAWDMPRYLAWESHWVALSSLTRLRVLHIEASQVLLRPSMVQLLLAVGPRLQRLYLAGWDFVPPGPSELPPCLFERMAHLTDLKLWVAAPQEEAGPPGGGRPPGGASGAGRALAAQPAAMLHPLPTADGHRGRAHRTAGSCAACAGRVPQHHLQGPPLPVRA